MKQALRSVPDVLEVSLLTLMLKWCSKCHVRARVSLVKNSTSVRILHLTGGNSYTGGEQLLRCDEWKAEAGATQVLSAKWLWVLYFDCWLIAVCRMRPRKSQDKNHGVLTEVIGEYARS